MNIEKTIKEIPIQCEKNLTALYEAMCEEYRRRLCEQWEIRLDNSWWIADVIGDELAFSDYWVLDMTEVKYCVDKAVSYEAYDEYWRFIMDEAENGYDRPRINFNSWFRYGARPGCLKLHKPEIPKSLLKETDIEAILKLQQAYTTLDQRLIRLLEWVIGLNKGLEVPFIIGDDRIDDITTEIRHLYEKLKEKKI